ncbi:WD repeat-containing protein 72, partial [Varanus komodoensis]
LAMKGSVQVVALWGKQAPVHSITAILITEDQGTIVTGSQEGQICLWDLSAELKISSKQMLFGHTASVTCLAKARDFEKQPYIVSSTENGEMCIWNVSCGQCVANARLPFRHTAICYYRNTFRMTGEGWLLCCGHYDDILVIDARTLAVLHTLASSHASDWISCMCLVHSPRIQEDSLIAVSAAGDLKVWDLSSSVSKIQEAQSINERESKSLDCGCCNAVRFCTYTERLLLVVFSTCWKVYDYCDFSLLWTEFSPSGQCFAGGDVLAAHRLIIWTEGGHGCIYQLLNSGLSWSVQPFSGGVLKETVHPVLLCSTDVEDNKSFSYVMGFMNERKEPFYKILYCGETSGRITLWHIPDVPVSTLDGSPKEIPIAASWALQDDFDGQRPVEAAAADHLCGADAGGRSATITSSVFIPSLDALVCGCEDGRIFIVLALQAAKVRLLEDASLLEGALPRRLLSGHSSSVTSLLYLHGQSARFDPSWLVSGSQDSCVIWWDMCTAEVLHHFSLLAGPVMDLRLSSENYRFKGHRIVCCICRDHSVVLLHIQERACILHARKHLFPVKMLRWHPVENLLVVGCENDSVYIWDIETGILERHESGEMAKVILACCEDSARTVTDPLLPVCEEDPEKQKHAGGQSSSSYTFGNISCGSLAHQGKSFACGLPAACLPQWPFTILPVKTKWGNTNFHVLLFDLEKLVEVLQSAPLNGLKASSSFHSYDTLKRAKSTAEKRTLMLKRNRTSASLTPLDGQVQMASEEQIFGENSVLRSSEQSGGIKRHKKAKSSKKVRRQQPGKVNLNVTTDAAKLLLSCLLPWGVDRELDDLCVRDLDILRLLYPVSFGLISKDNRLSLMLPGWGSANLVMVEQQHKAVNLFSSKVLDLCNKYIGVVQEQRRKSTCTTDRSSTLVYLLSRICLVQRIISRPLENTSPQKPESARSKRRPGPSLGTASASDEPAGFRLGLTDGAPAAQKMHPERRESLCHAKEEHVSQAWPADGKPVRRGVWALSPECLVANSTVKRDSCTASVENRGGEDGAEGRVSEASENPLESRMTKNPVDALPKDVGKTLKQK